MKKNPKQLKPIIVKNEWGKELETDLIKLFRKIIFEDLEDVFKLPVENAKDSVLVKRLKNGEVYYSEGVFRGNISAAVSKELISYGARWVKTKKGYSLATAQMPKRIFEIVTKKALQNNKIANELRLRISSIPERLNKIVRGLDFGKRARNLERQVTDKFRDTVTKQIGVKPLLSKDLRDELNQEYNQDITKSIVNFTQEETEKLRNTVEKFVLEGKSRFDLRDKIEARFKVSKERAKFIARQETSLYTSKLKEKQYVGAGIKKYKWKSIGDSRVRPLHAKLNNRVFEWEKPPIIDEERGERGHPGEAFGCRCQAVPIVDEII